MCVCVSLLQPSACVVLSESVSPTVYVFSKISRTLSSVVSDTDIRLKSINSDITGLADGWSICRCTGEIVGSIGGAGGNIGAATGNDTMGGASSFAIRRIP